MKFKRIIKNTSFYFFASMVRTVVSLVDKLDVKGLANEIEFLLNNPEIQKERSEKGYKRAHEMFVHSDDEIRESLLNAYKTVIKDFQTP